MRFGVGGEPQARQPHKQDAIPRAAQVHSTCRQAGRGRTWGARGRWTAAAGPPLPSALPPPPGSGCLQGWSRGQWGRRPEDALVQVPATQRTSWLLATTHCLDPPTATQHSSLSPGAAATAPKAPSPAMTEASHSTRPPNERLEPRPALPSSLSCWLGGVGGWVDCGRVHSAARMRVGWAERANAGGQIGDRLDGQPAPVAPNPSSTAQGAAKATQHATYL